MKHLFFILSFFLLFTPVFGQTSKSSVFVIPPIVKGGISDIHIQFLLITLDDALSIYFDISPPPQNKSGQCLTGCNFFQLEIEKYNKFTRLSLNVTSDQDKKTETKTGYWKANRAKKLIGGTRYSDLSKGFSIGMFPKPARQLSSGRFTTILYHWAKKLSKNMSFKKAIEMQKAIKTSQKPSKTGLETL